MTALPRQDQLFDVPPNATDDATDTTDGLNGERQQPKPPVRKARESDGVCAIYLQATGEKYKYQGVKDAEAWARMRKVASVEQIEERWRVALVAKGWCHVDTLAQLDMKWNDLTPLIAKQPISLGPALGACAACGAAGECAMWELPVCYRCYGAWLEEPAPDYTKAHELVRAWAVKRRTKGTP